MADYAKDVLVDTEWVEQHLNDELDFHDEAHNAELIASVISDYRDDLFIP